MVPQRKRRRRQDPRSAKERAAAARESRLAAWKPVTELGRKVKAGEITDIEQVFTSGEKILESEITELLIPGLHNDLLLIGQAKGKFGGGQRRIFRQTQKKTREGNRIKFQTYAVVGNKNGYVGTASGKSKETVPARDKSLNNAKKQLIAVRRGCGSWEGTADANSIPFAVTGKCGSVRLTLIPAPKGTGLCVEKECAKILAAAGIKDVWSKTKGQTKTKINLIKACMDALEKLKEMKVQERHVHSLGIVEGKLASSSRREDFAEVAVAQEAVAAASKAKK